jgi:hypothetical protein
LFTPWTLIPTALRYFCSLDAHFVRSPPI